MYPEYGLIALILAAVMAFLLALLPAIGVQRKSEALMSSADGLVSVKFVFVLISFVYLCISFLADDFSVAYVASNSNSLLPWYYKFSAVWGAHEGSMLLWVLVLCGWTLSVSLCSRKLPSDFRAIALASQGFLALGFLLFLILTSNPFARLLPFPAPEGNDLNPLLQDIGLIIHPPLLYMGYVGFSVAFSFAIAALVLGRFDRTWAAWLRPWTNTAWFFLTVGIVLGSWWAYYELGWGGWWFWDPVENASVMPWLLGTALVHSLSVARTRNLFHSWTILLAIFSFSLSLLGTFLVRSGVLTSVHAFASDPERGLYILMFLLLVVGGSLLLYGFRMGRIEPGEGFHPVSRETALLVNNLAMTLFGSIILLGTLYPLFIEALGMQSVSVGPPYFNSFLLMIGVPLLLLMGIGQRVRWRGDDVRRLVLGIPLPIVLSLAVSVALCAYLGSWQLTLLAGLFLSVWIVAHLLDELRQRWRDSNLRGALGSARWWGMTTAHIGVAVLCAGIVVSADQSQSLDARMENGTEVTLGEYRFFMDGVFREQGANYLADVADIYVWKDNRREAVLYPEKRTYSARGDVMTEAGIDAGLWRDLYVSMGEPLGNGVWAMRIQVKPLIRWVWFGGFLMGFGALIALFSRPAKSRNPV